MNPVVVRTAIVVAVTFGATACARRTESAGAAGGSVRAQGVAAIDPHSESAVLRALFDSLFAIGPTRQAVRGRLGVPSSVVGHAIRDDRDAQRWPLMYLRTGDSLIAWNYPDISIDFRVRGGDSSVAVRASPQYVAARPLFRPLLRSPGKDSTMVPAALDYALLGDTAIYIRQYGADAALELRYIRDTLLRADVRRSMCPPGPEC